MITGTFPKLHCQFKESALIFGQFTTTSGTPAASADTHFSMTCTKTTTGLFKITVDGGFKQCAVLQLMVSNPDSDDQTDRCTVNLDEESGGIDETNGLIYFQTWKDDNSTGVPALADPSDNSVIYVCLLISRA